MVHNVRRQLSKHPMKSAPVAVTEAHQQSQRAFSLSLLDILPQ
jgi:hypothetical protein